MKTIQKKWVLLAVMYFLLTSLFGVLLRYAFVAGLPDWLQYRNLQHGHSHLGMMGWIYSALYIFIVFLFELNKRIYKRLFWLTQLAVVGMMIAFPLQGYGLISISFTTLHLLASYTFIFHVLRDLRFHEPLPSWRLLKTALFFLFLSTLGTWALGGIMNTALKGSAWYYGAIQFFLHFQFNGWFIFAVLALFFKVLERYPILVEERNFLIFYRFLFISCLFTFFLAITWSTPSPMLFLLNSLGVLLQVAALLYFVILIRRLRAELEKVLKVGAYRLWKLAFYLLALKIIIQSLVAIPRFAIVSYTIHNFVIGFIHLLMLGIISLFLFGILRHFRLNCTKLENTGVRIFIIAFFLSELLLFIQGILVWAGAGFIPGYYEIIFSISCLFPLGIGVYLYDLVLNSGGFLTENNGNVKPE